MQIGLNSEPKHIEIGCFVTGIWWFLKFTGFII